MVEYFVSSSHNSYLMDPDQLAGRSSAEMYARLLLQGCRSVELDCWDGDNGEPLITHGMTLCTKVSFESVVEAIRDKAFVTSSLPVSLSLEMHCSRPQQKRIGKCSEARTTAACTTAACTTAACTTAACTTAACTTVG